MRAHAHTCVRPHPHACARTHMRAHAHTRTHTRTRTRAYTHTHTYTHTSMSGLTNLLYITGNDDLRAYTSNNTRWYEFVNYPVSLNYPCSTKHATMNGTTIAPGYVIINSPENDENVKFGEVKSIVATEDKRILLCIYECETLGYQAHFHSWEIKKTW